MVMKVLLRLINLLPRSIRKFLFVGLGLLRRPMTLGVRIVVRDEAGAFLLMRHTYAPGWHFPGGGVERRETIHQAAVKELREECHIETLEAPELFHFYYNPISSRFDHVGLFICTKWRQVTAWQPDHEIAEIGFFAADKLPEQTTQSTRNRIAELIDGKAVSDVW